MARLVEGSQGRTQSLEINLRWEEHLEPSAHNLNRLHGFREAPPGEGTPSGHTPAFPTLPPIVRDKARTSPFPRPPPVPVLSLGGASAGRRHGPVALKPHGPCAQKGPRLGVHASWSPCSRAE